MHVILQVTGELLRNSTGTALNLAQGQAEFGLYLAYQRHAGTELFIPESALDDWGNERTGIALHKWIQRQGDSFPRAELFGFSYSAGQEQLFMRELDLTVEPVLLASVAGESERFAQIDSIRTGPVDPRENVASAELRLISDIIDLAGISWPPSESE